MNRDPSHPRISAVRDNRQTGIHKHQVEENDWDKKVENKVEDVVQPDEEPVEEQGIFDKIELWWDDQYFLKLLVSILIGIGAGLVVGKGIDVAIDTIDNYAHGNGPAPVFSIMIHPNGAETLAQDGVDLHIPVGMLPPHQVADLPRIIAPTTAPVISMAELEDVVGDVVERSEAQEDEEKAETE
jgi:hypothetical protein